MLLSQHTRRLGLPLALAVCMQLACAPAVETPLSTTDLSQLQSDSWHTNPAPGAEPFPQPVADALESAWSQKTDSYVPRTKHLTADGAPLFTNRLFLETSPYLRQHAHNPVDWRPWGDEAFEEAARLGRPVLLSIGYSTCHWCHVMEEESFEDLEIARFLNEHYITIKVDREELPAVDAVYMAAVQALTGRGGWPMTVWLTADRQPFHGATYIPARDGDRGTQNGFLTQLRDLHFAYDTDPARVLTVATELSARIQDSLAPDTSGDMPSDADLLAITTSHKRRYDPIEGGHSRAPKFPSTLPLRFLLHEHVRTGDPELREMALHTLEKMAAGGMYDQVGGGFHRYSTDRSWLVPHFEKMLYDNALLTLAYLEGWQLSGDPELERVVRETLRALERDMTADSGAFYAATDADSLLPGSGEREEGFFFTWTPAELDELLDDESLAAVTTLYAVTDGGNFEGRSILHRPRPLKDVAVELGHTEVRLTEIVEGARETLYSARLKRPLPIRDDKIITGWNGLAISAHARAGLLLNEPAYTASAARAARFLLDHSRSEGELLRTFTQGEAKHGAVLEDYAFFTAGLIDLFEATGDPGWLTEAIALDAVVAAKFKDPEGGGWFRTPHDGPTLLAREKPDYDGAIPTGSSVHVLNLYRLAALTTQDTYRQRAETALKAHGESASRGAMAEMLLAVGWRLDTPKEIVLVAPSNRTEARRFLDVLATSGPRSRVLVVTTEADASDLVGVVPFVEGKLAIDGLATAYVCEHGLCQAPTTDPEVFATLLEPVVRLQK